MEGVNAIFMGKLLSLREQELIDYEKQDNGCKGGWLDDALEFIEKHGLTLEKEYKYKVVDQKCKKRKENIVYLLIDLDGDVDKSEPALVKAAAEQVSCCFQVARYRKCGAA